MRIIKYLPVSFLLAGLLLSGCKKKIITVPPSAIEVGWEVYEAGDFDAAVALFSEGTIEEPDNVDGWNGLGWSYVAVGQPTQSLSNLSTALAFGDGTVIGTEVLAALTFTYVDIGDYSAAVGTGLSAVGRSPAWIFSHDSNVTHHDLKVALAVAYFGSGNFAESLVWVQTLRSTFSVDVSSPAGRALLAEEIEIISTIY